MKCVIGQLNLRACFYLGTTAICLVGIAAAVLCIFYWLIVFWCCTGLVHCRACHRFGRVGLDWAGRSMFEVGHALFCRSLSKGWKDETEQIA